MSGTVYPFRLLPGDDLRAGIQRHAVQHGIEAGWIAACVGSLTEYCVRFAGRPSGSTGSGCFEILALCGTVSKHGSHLHLAIADEEGRTLGGHLLEGCRVFTTAEIVIAASAEHVFTRAKDGATGFAELQIEPRR